ncbi:hypothetical protein [Desulfotignum phosphitoxidans]|jgi:hypothetical protein|uniref:Uncharacterized protein n=1 Tax=Desulfotignum phosphitoxidans DSM 13687 TaxID=1286635 RepID=S0G3N9_9BACT|nr:hypothetical protein [Desulfotignum phosphitoxidans]EMS78852.1 hypothetical protein Dpo_6c00510 [Desulfotignum phosphitoxidans DSM 13687]
MNKIQNRIKTLSEEFTEWDHLVSMFLEAEYSDENEFSEEEYQSILIQLNNVLSVALTTFAEFSGTKDKFSDPQYRLIMMGQNSSITSEKMGVEFSFGIYRNSFFIETFIQYPWYLKSMDDFFWQLFLDLEALGDFKFQESAIPSSLEAKEILKHTGKSKSNIFNVIRNYILLESSGGSIDLGSLEISWPISTPWEDLLKNGIEAFKKLYRINYLLYRRYYLYLRSRK